MDEPPPMPQAVQRRYALALAGFHWDPHAGAWRREGLTLAEELIDRIDEETWQAYVQRWMATKPQPPKGAPPMRRERWRTAAAAEHFTVSGRFEATGRTGSITGIASVFGSVVQSWIETIVEPGTWTASLQRRPEVPVLWQHVSEDPIGVTVDLKETGQGLEFRAQLAIEDPQVRGYHSRMMLGAVKGVSVGFNPERSWIEERPSPQGPLRHLQQAELLELSVCTFPADSLAHLTDVHRRDTDTTAARLARLREAERTMATLERRGPPLTPERLDALFREAEEALRRICATAEARPSPTREYAAYVQAAAAAGRQVLPDGSLLPASVAEMAYLGPLYAQVQAQQAAATRERLRRLEEMELQASLRPWRR